MSKDRSRHAPITCKYNSTITEAHQNRFFAVTVAAVATDEFDFPTVGIQSSASENAAVFGELLEVNTENDTCAVQVEGLMYLRAKDTYAAANQGEFVSFSDTANQVKVAAIDNTDVGTISTTIKPLLNAPKIEGGFTIDESGTTVNILKCRK